MIDIEKIKQRLEGEYEHVKTFIVGKPEEAVLIACNFNDATFVVVSVYLDSEIGVHYTLEHAYDMEYVYGQLTAEQAEVYRDSIISEVEGGNATLVGEMNPKKLH